MRVKEKKKKMNLCVPEKLHLLHVTAGHQNGGGDHVMMDGRRQRTTWLAVACFSADILKANDEVIRVMALYEDTVHKPDVDSLLIDHPNEDNSGGWFTPEVLIMSVYIINVVVGFC